MANNTRPEQAPASRMNREDNEALYKKQRSPALRLLKYFRYVVPLLLLGVALAILANVAVIAKPFMLETLIDDYITVGNYDMNAITWLGVLYFLIVAGGAAAAYAQSQATRLMGQRLVHRLRTELFGHIQHMSMRFFDQHSSGSLLTRILSDIESISEFFTGVVISLFQQIVLIVGIVVAAVVVLGGGGFALYWFKFRKH